MTPAIRISSVSKWFYKRSSLFEPWRNAPKILALNRISCEIPQGTLFALVGPNGAGKTTLLKILTTLLLPDEGEFWMHGFSARNQASRIRSLVSFVLSEGRNFYWRLTARQNLEFFARLYNFSKKQIQIKIQILARQFRLEKVLDRPYEELSAGTRQRLALARAFLNDSSILLMDEPTRSLDPLAKKEVGETLIGLAREWGKTVLFATHDLTEAEEWADQIAILHEGCLLRIGTPEALRLSGAGKKTLEEVFIEACRDGIV